MLVGLRTIQALVKEGKDPVYKHLEFIAKKASMCRYKHDAFAGYGSCVREGAGLHGLEVFKFSLKMAAEDVAIFFCSENMLFNKEKSGKKTQDGGRRKQSKPCLAFNDGGCMYKLCNFSHICNFSPSKNRFDPYIHVPTAGGLGIIWRQW